MLAGKLRTVQGRRLQHLPPGQPVALHMSANSATIVGNSQDNHALFSSDGFQQAWIYAFNQFGPRILLLSIVVGLNTHAMRSLRLSEELEQGVCYRFDLTTRDKHAILPGADDISDAKGIRRDTGDTHAHSFHISSSKRLENGRHDKHRSVLKITAQLLAVVKAAHPSHARY